MKTRVGIVWILACAVGTVWSASVTTDADGNTVVDVPAGETYTYAQAIGGVGLRKTGSGTVKFGTASSATTPISLEGGIADFTVAGACGKGNITVSDGAQLCVSHNSTGQQNVQVPGTVTIQGAGPDGTGAIVYTNSGMGDKMFQKVVLAADAAIGGKRWGALNLDFAGHTLTWVGTNLMALDAKWTNFGTFIHKGSADLCFQTVTFDASCTADKEVVLDTTAGGHISFWNCSTPAPFKLVVKESSRVAGNSGTALNRNVWAGPIEIAEGKTLTLATRNPGDGGEISLRIAGKITGAGKVATSGDYGIIYLDNESNDWTGGTSVAVNRLAPLSPATLPGVTEGKVVNEDTGTKEYFLFLNVGPAKTGANVQHTWTTEEIQVLQDHLVRPTGHFGGLAFDVPAGTTYTYPSDIKQHLGFPRLAGTVRFTGVSVTNTSLNVRGAGRVELDAAGEHLHRTFNVNNGGVLDIRQGTHTLVGGMIRIGNGTRGSLWQEPGTVVAQTASDNPFFGEAANSYGVWFLDHADFTYRNTLTLAKGTNSYGVVLQKGGRMLQTTAGTQQIGYSGDAMMYIGAAGTNEVDTCGVGGTATQIGCAGNGGTSVLTVDGTGSVYRTHSLILGNNDAPHTNLLNVCDGGAVEADRFYKNCYYANDKSLTSATVPPGSYNSKDSIWYIPYSNHCFSVINANGGVLVPTFGYGWNHVGTDCPPRDPDKVLLYEKGLVVDTTFSQTSDKKSFASQTFPFHLDTPTGRGFDAIYLPTNNATFKGLTYIGPARIRIKDATGWAASAFADFDRTTGKLTGVKVTSRGCDYSANPTVTVDSADGKSTFACTYTLSENVCGGLTKRGATTMELWNTKSAYTGTTCVEQGTLRVGRAGALPRTTHCRVKAGATLQLPGASTLKSIGGSGTISAGAVTLTDGFRAHAEDLNAARPLTVNNALTFAEGAKVTVDDLADLAPGPTAWPLVTATSAIVGTPEIDSSVLSSRYGLSFSPDRKKLSLVVRGTTLILR